MRIRRYLPGTAVVIAFLVVVAAAVSWSIKTNDIIFLPSPAEAIDTKITVADHPLPPHHGTLYITFVLEEQANLLNKFYYQHFDPDATILSSQTVYGTSAPPPSSQQQQQGQAQMLSSKENAEVAAFNALGYDLPGEVVAITAIEKNSHAYGRLRAGDVVVSANGHAVHTPRELVAVVQAAGVNHPVTLKVRRGGSKTLTFIVRTIRSKDTGKAIVGVGVQTVFLKKPRLPYKVTINSGDIGGPSAGLMFSLGIYNHLSRTDITHGYKIAGTGEIDASGAVYPIGGVKQKVIGAREAGAKYFIVPRQYNYAEAKPYAKGIRLLPVNTVYDALAALKKLH